MAASTCHQLEATGKNVEITEITQEFRLDGRCVYCLS